MRSFAERAEDYLRLRHALGHKLDDAVRHLPRFVAHLERIEADTITTRIALDWVQERQAEPNSSVWARRMTVARGFARHMAGIDPRTEIPPLGLVTFHQRWRPPFIFSEGDIKALMTEAVRAIPTRLRAATYQTMIGLLAATGMRVGEVIRLERADVNWDDGVILVKVSKFTKSRLLPVDSTILDALGNYAELREQVQPRPRVSNFFISAKGTPVIYTDFGAIFRELVNAAGVGAESASIRPRIHDLRHSFAVNVLVTWYRAGEDVAALLPRLATYLGHRDPKSTYWYLSAAPELLALAVGRLETSERLR